MDNVMPTVLDTNGFGGAGMGAGFIGGLVLGSLWNGNGFGFGGNGRGVNAVADVGLANSIQHVGDAVNQGTISQLQSASANQMATMGASANIAEAIGSNARDTQAAINATNITSLQNTQQISNGMANLGQAITNQGYENRLQAQALAAQLASQHAELSAQIFKENCADRELTREIATQALRDKLAEAQAKNASLEAQINLTNQLSAQTQYLISQLKTTTTTAAGA